MTCTTFPVTPTGRSTTKCPESRILTNAIVGLVKGMFDRLRLNPLRCSPKDREDACKSARETPSERSAGSVLRTS